MQVQYHNFLPNYVLLLSVHIHLFISIVLLLRHYYYYYVKHFNKLFITSNYSYTFIYQYYCDGIMCQIDYYVFL